LPTIPHFLHVFPSFEAAGAQARTAALMADFGARYRHSLVALDDAWGALEWVPDEVALERVSPSKIGGPLGQARGLARLLRQLQPDLLCTYNWGSFDAVIAARLAGQRAHVHHEDGFHADEAQAQHGRRVLARRLLLRRAKALVVPSKGLEQLALHTWRLPPARVHWIPNGIDAEAFCPEPAGTDRQRLRTALGLPENALVIGGVGRLNPVKRFDRLIRACSRLNAGERPVHVWIAGEGTERAALEALAAENPPPGGKVHFLGYRTDLVPLYRAFDLFVISSDSEQQPVSQLEAMASGVPVAGTSVGDVPATLPEAAREHLVDPTAEDAEAALGRVLERLLQDPQRRAELARLGRERVLERYSRTAMLDAYGKLYAAALA
jgi:glycosyltransferase involved in cell wall biosynthesis